MLKKIIFLLFVTSFTAKAQSWCPPGAQWHYKLYYPYIPYYNGYIQLNTTGTVTVGGQTCANLSGTYYGFLNSSSSPSTTASNFVTLQTYQSNKVTYVYNPNTLAFDTIADFKASIGDKWHLIKFPPSAYSTTCNFPSPIVTVTDTSHVVINGFYLKRLALSYQYNSQTFQDTLIERISSITGFLFPFYHCVVDGPYYGSFVCYSDNNFPLYKRSGVTAACDYITSVRQDKGYDRLKVFPNPVQDVIRITFDENLKNNEAEILDITSQVVIKEKLNSENAGVNLSRLEPGVYFLRVRNEAGAAMFKIIKD